MTDDEFLAEMKAKYPKNVRVGKVTGCVRLTGKTAMDALRREVYWRGGGRCSHCGRAVHDGFSDEHPLKYDMAHIRSRGAGGSDLPGNCRVMCHACHMREHAGKL
jgi:ferredoxin